LLNILGNSIKYARPNAPPELVITQTTHKSDALNGAKIVTRIRDNGAGIADADLRRVFEPFSRGQTKSNEGPGSGGFGLGLAMVAKVISAMGGRVWAEQPSAVSSGPSHGAVICIELPAALGSTP
jgi:two-component system sensor histidine kinase PfeS